MSSAYSRRIDRSRRKLAEIRLNRKIWRHDQMKSFYATTLKNCSELGAWATDYYVSQVVAKMIRSAVEPGPSVGIWDLATAEKQYLAKALKLATLLTKHQRAFLL
jgi:hypothetical protein